MDLGFRQILFVLFTGLVVCYGQTTKGSASSDGGVTLSTVTTSPQTPPCNETVDPDCVNGTDSGEEISNDTQPDIYDTEADDEQDTITPTAESDSTTGTDEPSTEENATERTAEGLEVTEGATTEDPIGTTANITDDIDHNGTTQNETEPVEPEEPTPTPDQPTPTPDTPTPGPDTPTPAPDTPTPAPETPTPPTDEPTQAPEEPTQAPEGSGGNDEGHAKEKETNGHSTSLILGILIPTAIVVSVAVAYVFYRKKKAKPGRARGYETLDETGLRYSTFDMEL